MHLLCMIFKAVYEIKLPHYHSLTFSPPDLKYISDAVTCIVICHPGSVISCQKIFQWQNENATRDRQYHIRLPITLKQGKTQFPLPITLIDTVRLGYDVIGVEEHKVFSLYVLKTN